MPFDATPGGLTPLQKEELAARCWRSPSEFCRIVLPHWFPTKMPWVHRGVLAMMTGHTEFLLDFGPEEWSDGAEEWTTRDLEKVLLNFIDEQTGHPIFDISEVDGKLHVGMTLREHCAFILPRGFSKTTLVNAMNLRDALYQAEDFFLYVSESAPHAERQLGTMKFELEDNEGLPNNPVVTHLFGLHKPPRQSSLKWTENYIETLKGIMVGAVGRGGQIRGFGKRAKRPGKIVFDDIEDEDSVASDTQRKKDSGWFFNSATPAKRRGGHLFAIGTLLHTDAILNKLMSSPEWTCVRFGAIDRQGEALWPFMMTLEGIERKKIAAAAVGETPGFFMEYMSEYRTDEARIFPLAKLIYCHKGLECFVGVALALDPAISEAGTADFCAFGVVGIEAGGHKHTIDYFGARGMGADEQIDKFFELHYAWLSHLPLDRQLHGIESIAFQRALIGLVRGRQFLESRKHGDKAYFEVLPIFHGKIAKITRVQGVLRPLIWAGHFSFEHRWAELETMFTDWPSGKKDGPDVLAMATMLLDPFAALNIGDDMGDLIRDRAPPLSQVVGNFRAAP